MPVSSVVITVEGVLKKYVTNAPIPVGIALYHGLANTFNLLLVTDSTQAEINRWCALEGLNKHAAVKVNEGIPEYLGTNSRRIHQVKELRKDGYSIDLVIEPSPIKCKMLLEEGFSVMNYIHAEYSIPQWRPDFEYKPREWDEIQKYETEMAEIRAMKMLQEEKKD